MRHEDHHESASIRTGKWYMPHDGAFASDSLTDAERDGFSPLVRDGQCNLEDTAQQLRERLEQGSVPEVGKGKQSNDPGGRVTPNKPVATPENSLKDTSDIEADLDPCGYLHAELTKLTDSEHVRHRVIEDQATQTTLSDLEDANVHASIAAVVRVIDELLPSGHGVTMLSHDGKRIFSFAGMVIGVYDPMVLHVRRRGGHTILLVFQREHEAEYPPSTAYVMNSAPWTFTPAERTQLHEAVWNWKDLIFNVPGSRDQRSMVPEVLTWTPSPQQTDPQLSAYFAIGNAWAVLLGLALNTDFTPSKPFYRDLHLMLQAVQTEHASWKLIYTFRACFGYIRLGDLPPPERRLKVQDALEARIINTKKQRPPLKRWLMISSIAISLQMLACRIQIAPVGRLSYEGDDRGAGIAELIGSGQYTRSLRGTPTGPSSSHIISTDNGEVNCSRSPSRLILAATSASTL
jgi:hypothetical protein